MTEKYNPDKINALLGLVEQAGLHYRRPPKRYEPGKVLEVKVTGVCPAVSGRAKLRLEAFAGGGFAGQVYRTTLLELEPTTLDEAGLRIGGTYAIKIHVPPSGFSRRFRDAVYWLGYQGAFPARVDANAARSGALWQKLIRRAAGSRFGDERCVADIHATFFDPEMGSFGEIGEWVEGRIWRLEFDWEVLGRRKKSSPGAGSSREYLAKKQFMANFVSLLHDMGAEELGRQYEWWSCKSQPNVYKRLDAEARAADGLTALDFRPGLALLFCLPMSPVDFKLILQGLRRGAWVQFDRGDLKKLQAFCRQHEDEFAELLPALRELEEVDPRYRESLPDISRHGMRLLRDGALRQRVKAGLVGGWECLGLLDRDHAATLRQTVLAFWCFYLAGAVPFLGKRIRRLWGNPDYRKHIGSCFASLGYLRRALRARQAECLVKWLRKGRVGESGVEFFLRHPALFAALRVFPGLLPLPAKMHRMLLDWKYAVEKTRAAFVFPVRFYRDADFRKDWLNHEVEEGMSQGLLGLKEKEKILSQVGDPFIQKYLKCLAVHFATFPITRIVMLLVGVYAYFHFGDSWQESMAYALGALLLIGVVLPISPGSLARGFYVVYLMIKERNVRNYWLAAAVSFWRCIGYLGFPLQMVKEFPALARLLTSRWVTRVVRIVPVFGESGALLEHLVFDLCVNVPLSIKRRCRGEKVPASAN
jgi:hypothetical protein